MMYLWLILNLADLVLTILVVRNGGTEVMPIMGYLLNINIVLFIFAKTAGALAVLYIFKKLPGSLPIANGAFGAIVLINALSLYIIGG